jgi:hypothetical protein
MARAVKLTPAEQAAFDDRVLAALWVATRKFPMTSEYWQCKPGGPFASAQDATTCLNGGWQWERGGYVYDSMVRRALRRLADAGYVVRPIPRLTVYELSLHGELRFHEYCRDVRLPALRCRSCDRHPATEQHSEYSPHRTLCGYCRDAADQHEVLFRRRLAVDRRALEAHERRLRDETIIHRFRLHAHQGSGAHVIDVAAGCGVGEALKIVKLDVLGGYRVRRLSLSLSPDGPPLEPNSYLPPEPTFYLLFDGALREWSYHEFPEAAGLKVPLSN